MSIMSIDPGGKSGIAIRTDDGTLMTCICESLFDKKSGTRQVRYDATELYEILMLPTITHVILETFQAQKIDQYGLHTVRLCGAVEAICYVRNIKLTKHIPQDRYPFKTEAKIWLQDQKKPYLIHELDALAHLLRYEYDNGIKFDMDTSH